MTSFSINNDFNETPFLLIKRLNVKLLYVTIHIIFLLVEIWCLYFVILGLSHFKI